MVRKNSLKKLLSLALAFSVCLGSVANAEKSVFSVTAAAEGAVVGDSEDSGNIGGDIEDGSENPYTAESFVERLYEKMLGRAAENGETEEWAAKLTGGTTAIEFAYALMSGSEFEGKSYSDEEFLSVMYSALLDKAADSGAESWLELMAEGLSRKHILYTFADSAEFEAVCADYGVVCGETEADDIHDFSDWKKATDGNCSVKGTETRSCVCGETETRDTVFGDHVFSDWAVTVEGSCTADRVEERTCSECDVSERNITPAIGHSADDTIWLYNYEEHWHVCCNCDEKMDVAAHKFEETSRTDATCTSEGKVEYKCVCGKTKSEVIEKLAHVYSEKWSSDETNHWHECVCGDKADLAKHNLVETSRVDATCIAEGKVEYGCVCGKTKTEVLEKLPHTYSTVWSKDEANHWHECVCGDKADLAKHNLVETSRIAATCTAEGKVEYKCVCGEAKTEILEKLPHTYSTVWSNDGANHWHKCTGCDSVSDMATHTISEWIVDREATSLLAGIQHRECTVCKYITVIEEIPVTVSAEDFVVRLYEKLLCRPADEGKAYHIAALDNGKTAADVAQGFVLGPELKAWNISNEEFVRRMYLTFLDREADTVGLISWSLALNNGCSYGFVLQSFCASAEFKMICDSCGIEVGKYVSPEPRDANEKVTFYCARMYVQALARPYDVDGLNNWTAACNAGMVTPEQIALTFLTCPEIGMRNLSNEDYVVTLYWTVFGRAPDESGMQTWVNLLNLGVSRQAAVLTFLGSSEFAMLKANLGV